MSLGAEAEADEPSAAKVVIKDEVPVESEGQIINAKLGTFLAVMSKLADGLDIQQVELNVLQSAILPQVPTSATEAVPTRGTINRPSKAVWFQILYQALLS
jgi:hypothetical protein